MPTQIKNSDTTDYTLLYFISDIYTKANCILKSYRNNDNTFEANEIMDGLYLGNINSVYDYKKLKELGITHIISVLAGFEPPFPNDFEYLVINALDTTNTILHKNFEASNQFIEEAFENNGKVLVHCMAGRSRSATILAAYIISKFGMNTENAIKSMQSKRDIVQPNNYFMSQLKNYYTELYNDNEQ